MLRAPDKSEVGGESALLDDPYPLEVGEVEHRFEVFPAWIIMSWQATLGELVVGREAQGADVVVPDGVDAVDEGFGAGGSVVGVVS